MEKELLGKIKIVIAAGGAMAGNPLGPALGQKQVNIKKFCDEFNPESLKKYKKGTPVRTVISAYKDKTFSFELLGISVTTLIKEALNLKSGSKEAGKETVATISLKQIEDIAKIKMQNNEFNTNNLQSAMQMVIGSVKSMGIKVEA